MITSYFDWRGGYCSDIPDELMADNELLVAENCYWENGLKKRLGIESYIDSFSSDELLGMHRAYVNSAWQTFIGVANAGATTYFQYGASLTFTTITRASGTAYTSWSTGDNIRFANLGDNVIAVNGTDRPAIIYETAGGVYIEDLDRYDKRTIGTDNWYAGIVDASANYTDDTTDAQSSASSDFQLASGTGTSGFWVSSDLTYSQVNITDAASMTGSFTTDYQYWNGSAWASIPTLNNTPTWTSLGDKTLEFEIPMASNGSLLWKPYDASDNGTLNAVIDGRYPIRVMFDGNTNTPSAAKMEVEQTHYLSQIMGDERPQAVAQHKSHIFLAAGMQIQISVAHKVTDWRADRFEVVQEGGSEISQMISHQDYLAILKEDVLYGLYGNSWSNWHLRRLAHKGTISKQGAAVAKDILFFPGRDGIYAWDGAVLYRVSKHIQDEYDALQKSIIGAVNYKDNILMTFAADSTVLWFDPDTMRNDIMGDKRISFYKWKPIRGDFILNTEVYESGGVLLFLDRANNIVHKYVNHADNTLGSNTAPISMTAQTKFLNMQSVGIEKLTKRVKPRVSDVSATSAISYAITFLKNDEYGGASSAATMNASVSDGYHQEEFTVPHTVDGRNFGMSVVHNATYNAAFFGFSVETHKRRF